MKNKFKKSISTNESQLRKDLKKEFLYFCQTTTIRGVTRVVNARNQTLQTLWIASVILFFGGLFICMFILIKQYLEYNVIHPPQVLRDTPSPFPSLTLCNLRPLSSEANSILNKYNLKSPRQFAIDVNNFAAKAYYYSNDKHSYQQVTSAISMGGYLESLPQIVVSKLGHNLSHTVIHCMVIHAEGSKRVMNECIQVGRWRQFIHAQYLNCYTYDIYEVYRNHVRTIELYVYLDESMNITSCSDCFSSEIKSQLSGAVVTVHNAETYPDINQEGINIQPGSLTEIKVKTIKHTQKTPPYGRCSPNTPTKINLYGSEVYAYSEHACRMSTIQAKINALCGCNAIEFPYINESLPFCLEMSSFVKVGHCDIQRSSIQNTTNQTLPKMHTTLPLNNQKQQTQTPEIPLNYECLSELEAVKNRVLCKSEVTKHYQGDVVLSCTLPCAFFAYETDRSTSTWPTKSWQLSWLSTRAGKKVVNRPDLAGYRMAKQRLDVPGGEKEAEEFLAKSNVLERNLLAIMLIRPNFNVHKVS
ncbi:FMRFamide-activated amiloride-sensitive sodium channel [Schistosoma japonicum]|uniref:FMRFamide-activated amiloride-sensitive sodium channel n=1 Tax=Schistosoma japonicum TaxID=6182 RepID=A0A4Z2DB23_SCHJA|nr:FMRFamide-activated amiloride-sensitive sodium channel [Schistosoma japonicum]